MVAQATEGTGQGSAEGKLRGFDLDKIHKVLIGQMNLFKSCTNVVDGKYILKTTSDEIPFDNVDTDLLATTVQNAIEEIENNVAVSTNILLLYRPGETTEGRIFGTWTELYNYFLNTDGLIYIGFDTESGNITFDPGVWDMQNRVIFIAASTLNVVTTLVTLVTDDTVTFKNITKISGNLIWLHQGVNNPAIKYENINTILATMTDTVILSSAAGSAPFFEIATGQFFVLILDYAFLAGIQPAIRYLNGADNSTIYVRNLGTISDNCVSSFVGTNVTIYVSSDIDFIPDNFTDANGDVFIIRSSKAENIFFNNLNTNFTSETIQDALEEISATTEFTFDSTDLNGSNIININHNMGKQYLFVQLINSSDQLIDINSIDVTFTDNDNLALDFTGSGHMPFSNWTFMMRK